MSGQNPSKTKTEKGTLQGHLFESWAFTRTNYVFFGVGLLVIVLGYVVMALGSVNSFQSLTLAPILLFAGYIILIPLALILRPHR